MSSSTVIMEDSMGVTEKTKNRTTIQFSNPTSGYLSTGKEISISKGYLHPHVYYTTGHNSYAIGWTKIFIKRWTDKENNLYIYNEILAIKKNKLL